MSDNVRLCRTLGRAIKAKSDEVEDKAASVGVQAGFALMSHSVLLCALGDAFLEAADALERDEMQRLGVVGQQSRELMAEPEQSESVHG
jgi:hypothetical protein